MTGKLLELEIISPEKSIFKGQVSKVLLPGGKAPFTVLYNHAPAITTLCAGDIVWSSNAEEHRINIKGGFADVVENKVTACVEI